jgi:hypothetical protein
MSEYKLPETTAVTQARKGLLAAFNEVTLNAAGDARFKTENGVEVSIRNWDPCPEVIFTTPEGTLPLMLDVLEPIYRYVHALEHADDPIHR